MMISLIKMSLSSISLLVNRSGVRAAFSLIELLTVIAIMSALAAVSVPAIQALKSSGGINKAIVESSQTLEYARVYAMSSHTYVRVGIGQSGVTGSSAMPSTVLVVIYSVDGTLDADTVSGMTDTSKWRRLVKPVILDNLMTSSSLNVDMELNSTEYTSPDKTDIPSPVPFRVGGIGMVSCYSFIQFNPNGEARVVRGEPARFIDFAVDKPKPQNGRNPFVLRVSGLSGNISILRKGEGIQ